MRERTAERKYSLCEKKLSTVSYVAHVFLLVLLMALLLPHLALAYTERFVLDYDDAQYTGNRRGIEIYLKKALKERYPEVNVSEYRLRRVIVVAQSKNGKGSAQLRIGPEMTSVFNVGQRTFTGRSLENPFKESWGPWRLFLNGDIALREVVLVVEKKEVGK